MNRRALLLGVGAAAVSLPALAHRAKLADSIDWDDFVVRPGPSGFQWEYTGNCFLAYDHEVNRRLVRHYSFRPRLDALRAKCVAGHCG